MRFGTKAMEYLKETDVERYNNLQADKEVFKQFEENVNHQAREYYDKIMEQLLKENPVKDQNDFTTRVQHMNKLKSIAEEITLHDIIYKDN